uniref:Hydrophobin n=1 Tax=Mesocestoides corti TaxID=53468 RepID=A0A5K3FCD0_MESCO
MLAKKTMWMLAGLPENSQEFAPNQAWCEWAEANGCLPVGEEDDDQQHRGHFLGQAVCVNCIQVVVNEYTNTVDLVEVGDVGCLVGFCLNPDLELFA